MPFATTWMDLESIILNEVSQRRRNISFSDIYIYIYILIYIYINPLQYSYLENPMDIGPQATVHGVAKSWTELK